jgi:arylsulfatase A-like enzyme
MKNILVIIADQLRRNSLSCYGNTDINTPNIDYLATNGVKFENACSTYPVCVPFRYSLMTGNYAHKENIAAYEFQLPPSQSTLADTFNHNAYETIYIGKWHLYCAYKDNPQMTNAEMNRLPVPREYQGHWEHWRGFDIRNDPFDTCYFIDDNPEPVLINDYQTNGLFDLAKTFLKNEWDSEKPFCMILSVEPPHDPLVAPEKNIKKCQKRDIQLSPNVPANTSNDAVDMLRKYYAMIENFDENVGSIMSFLENESLKNDTIVVILSDHGELGGSHGLFRKQYPYEESIGIPFIVYNTMLIKSQVIKQPVATEDIYPTLLGLAGLEVPDEKLGLDLSPMIFSETVDISARPGVLLQFVRETRKSQPFYDEIWRGFRSERYKYIVSGNIKNGFKPWLFFDLQKDPFEMNNLINEPNYKKIIAQHHEWLVERMREVDDNAVEYIERI